MKKTFTAALVLAATIGLVGCSTGHTTTPSSQGDSKTSDAPAAEKADGTLAFGDTATYKDGIELTVSAPEGFAPGQYASGADQAANVIFTVTVKNGSKENFKPTLIYAKVSSAGTEGSHIFDTENKLDGSPSTVVLPGKSITYLDGWSLADAADIVYQITPSAINSDDAIFTNTK